MKKQIQRSAAQAEKEREEQRQALRDRLRSEMCQWDGQVNGAIAAAGAVIKGVVSAAEADALQRQVNTLKDAAQLRADDVVIFLLEQLYGSGRSIDLIASL